MVVNGLVAIVPSDATSIKAVLSVLFFKQKNWIYDTEFSDTYKEVGGAFSENSNTGFFGPGKARFVTSDVNRKAYYLLNNLPRLVIAYRAGGWRLPTGVIKHLTLFAEMVQGPTRFFANQIINGGKWNLLGS